MEAESARPARRFSGLFQKNLQALQHRPFALLWAGQVTSRLGDSIYTIALAWWVLKETGSAFTMSTVVLAAFAPMLLFVLVGGVLGDRVSRLRVMFAADVIRGGVALVLAMMAAAGLLELWVLYAGSVVFGFAQAFFQPAYVAVVPELTPEELLPSANALTALSMQLATVVGPAIGAATIALGGVAIGFALNGASFIVSAMTLLAIDWSRARSVPRAERRGVFREAWEGLQTILGKPWLWFTIALASLLNLTLTGPMRVTLPYLLREERGLGASSYGVLLASGAAGSVLAAIALGRAGKLRRRGLLAYLALIANGLMLLLFATDAALPVLWAAAFVGGAYLALFELIWVGTLQEMVPRERLGRVASFDYLGSFGLLPVGFIVAGVATDALGAQEVLLGCGAITTLLAVVGLAHPAIRRLD